MNTGMAHSKKPKSRKTIVRQENQSRWPRWYFPSSPIGSALHYLAAILPHLDWVGISLLNGRSLEFGPHGRSRLSASSEKSKVTALIQNQAGETLGQIDALSAMENAFGFREKERIKQVARELGVIWSE